MVITRYTYFRRMGQQMDETCDENCSRVTLRSLSLLPLHKLFAIIKSRLFFPVPTAYAVVCSFDIGTYIVPTSWQEIGTQARGMNREQSHYVIKK